MSVCGRGKWACIKNPPPLLGAAAMAHRAACSGILNKEHTNSSNLVLLISVSRQTQTLTLELHRPTLVLGRITRANPNPPQVLRAGSVHPPIVLRANGITSGPADLRLPSAAFFDNNPVPATPALLNQDIVVDTADLQIIYQRTFAYSG